MAQDYYDEYDDGAEPPRRDNLFLWTVFILLLIGVAFACWLGSFYIFGHPEQPKPYKILKKLGKVEPPKRFEVTAAPPGEFLNPQKLFERYSKMTRLELERENAELLRNYIKNYRETKKLVPYATGRFEIISSYELQQSDMFPSGVVALAQAIEFPQVLIEHVYTAAPSAIPALRTMLQTGLDMKLERTLDLAAVVHVERTFDGRLQFTVMPLLYGTYAVKQGVGTFGLEPPHELNIEAGVPIVKGKLLQDSMRTYAEFRRKKPTSAATEDDENAPKGPELVRLDSVKPGSAVPVTGELPEPPVATPIPVGPPPKGAHASRATPAKATPPVVALNTTPRPRATPEPEPPVATPAPVVRPPSTSPQGVPLKPFIASAPAPNMQNSGASWRTYGPGQQPSGRTMSPSEASALADRGDLGERLYLRGSFVVTASGENRAVLRSQGASGDPTKPGSGAARIIVEYPASAAPPPEGATFARDDSRGFEIRDVRRGADGQINIYVREVTQVQ
ncbi:hypothetical protein ACXR0O_24550 [Verrucomicrobiota bacterium sgz303538]